MLRFEIIFFSLFAFAIFMAIREYIKNEKSPVISTKAQLIEKKINKDTDRNANGFTTTDETLILVFKLDTGSELKFIVGSRVFTSVPQFELGTLTFQGTRFLKFDSPSGVVEK